jgi:hypothetical protein
MAAPASCKRTQRLRRYWDRHARIGSRTPALLHHSCSSSETGLRMGTSGTITPDEAECWPCMRADVSLGVIPAITTPNARSLASFNL